MCKRLWDWCTYTLASSSRLLRAWISRMVFMIEPWEITDYSQVSLLVLQEMLSLFDQRSFKLKDSRDWGLLMKMWVGLTLVE